MLEIEDFSDERQKVWCIHCGAVLENSKVNHDHVPSKSLLSRDARQRGTNYDRGFGELDDYLPQVVICKSCNSSFSQDENYLLCVLHAATAGSLYPNPESHPEAAKVLKSNRHVVRELRESIEPQIPLFDEFRSFTFRPDSDRVIRAILKNARGHVYHEIGEPLFEEPERVTYRSLVSMADKEREAFEDTGGLEVWPEVGSRMLLRVINGVGLAGGWVTVEEDRYRYAVDWSSGITVRTVIWEYLATETYWTD